MLMTPEEFDAVTQSDERYSYELVRRIVIVSPWASPAERSPNDELGYMLRLYSGTLPEGSALDGTLFEQYVIVPGGRRRADRVIWAGLGRPPVEDDVPTIVIEFVSKTTRDRIRDYEEKPREYLDLGVLEYWIIDRFERTMTIHRKLPAEPARLLIKAEETYRTPVLPGFELSLAELLRKSDQWPAKRRRK
jgi:Uma2 family endonuclease